jgi:predicted nucleotidyltransferase
VKTYLRIAEKLKRRKGQLIRKYDLSEIGLFGSFVRGDQTKSSDLDVLVEFKKTPDLFRFLELEGDLEDYLKVKVDLVRKRAIRKELKKHILDEVVPI